MIPKKVKPTRVVPINPEQTMVKPSQLAGLLGISRTTLYMWTVNDARVRACVFRPGYYSVQKLRDAGLLTRPEGAAS